MRQENDAAERGTDSADRAGGNLTPPDDRRLIIDALTRLSATQRAVILRSFYMRWTTAQIAADLKIADITAKSRLHDALRALARGVGTGERG
jgi:RNA polymerase sigma-70 factor (ECF subfamily)